MVHYTRLLSLLGLAFLFSCKQKTVFASAPGNTSLLWEISGNGLKKPSYFLGTMHIMCADDAILSENVKSIIKIADQVYLEVDMDNIGELISGATSLSMKETTLADILTDADYQRVKSFFEDYHPEVPFSILEKQQPMMIASGLYELFLACEQKKGIDLMIMDEAVQQRKETRGLETMAFQTSIFDSIPYEAQAIELVKTIDNIDTYKRAMEDMIIVYKTQDIEKLHELTTREEAGVNNYLDLLIYNRNANWVNLFRPIAKEKVTLFAVGAGHLGGEKGVINLLRKNGYQVRPLQN